MENKTRCFKCKSQNIYALMYWHHSFSKEVRADPFCEPCYFIALENNQLTFKTEQEALASLTTFILLGSN
jgi:hypothetical protein